MSRRGQYAAIGVLLVMITALIAAVPTVGSHAERASRYVALGDSVAAGLGLPATSPAIGNDVICGRSAQAYPVRVARAMQLNLQQVACSGAKANDGVYKPQSSDQATIASQLDQAYAGGVPDVMTMTVGANDMRWTQFVQACYAFDCGGVVDGTAAAAYRLALNYKLTKLFSSVQQRSGSRPPTMYVTGYFLPYGPQNCADTTRLTTSEKAWLNEQAAKLNQTIAAASNAYSFVRYVPVDFSGHELCSATPWIQGLQASAPYHPTAAGQTAISQAVLAAMSQPR